MADQVVPNTESQTVAAIALAWEIVKYTYNVPHMEGTKEEKLKEVTNAVIKAYMAILQGKPIEKQLSNLKCSKTYAFSSSLEAVFME